MLFKFIKYTRIWFIISILVIAAGIGGMVRNKMNPNLDSMLVYGIDFTGGSLMEVDFEEGIETEGREFKQQVSAAFQAGFPESGGEIRDTSADTFIIRSKTMTDEDLNAVTTAINEQVGGFELVRYETIGPKFGESLRRGAIIALTLALVAIVLYIAYAFRRVPKRVSPWKFGFAAIVALAHDVLITLGVFALFQFEVNAFFITALLTIMGFSVHDTIVVFDRIRENLRHQGRDDTFGVIADESLNQTLTRSINTSISTLFPLVALYIWGSSAIQPFVLALIIGIIVGTYSSIFIASPVLTLWQEKGRDR